VRKGGLVRRELQVLAQRPVGGARAPERAPAGCAAGRVRSRCVNYGS
jgi:hypothetical protein